MFKRNMLIIYIIDCLLISVTGCGQSNQQIANVTTEEIFSDTESYTHEETMLPDTPAVNQTEINYEQRKAVLDAVDFTGNWNRTNIMNQSFDANIEITNQDEDGFVFEAECTYYSHSGIVEGKAYFISSHMAVYEYENEYIIFIINNDEMTVIASACGGEIGMGANVSIDGEYIKGGPEYINADILEDNFNLEELISIRNLLGDEIYEENFEWIVRYGVITKSECKLPDGRAAVYYEAFVPTMGNYSFKLLKCSDGDIYFEFENENLGFMSNADGAVEFPEIVMLEGNNNE